MKKRLAQQKQRTVPEPNSQSERAAEPKDYKPKLPPPLLTEPKFESLSDLQPRQEPTQNEGLPAVSVTAAASAQEASPPDELETKGEKVRSTLPPPFRRQKHGKLEEATEEDTAQADEIIEPAAPESGVEGQLDTLCKQMQQAVAAREDERAETISREILQIAPGNPQAYSFLETRYRRKQQYQELRELLLRSTQDPELSLDNRKLRLREAAGISQNKLKDIDGAIENWNSLLNLDPDDGNAKQALKRLLQSVERWDELVAMLDKEAMGTSDSELEADLIEQIVLLQREKRHDKEEEIIALRQLHALRPNDKEVRNSLCDALLEVGRAREAISFLRERIAESKDGRTAVQLLYRLASLLESDVADIEQAYQAYRQIFAISAEERRALDNLERIDEQLGRFDRLLKTLELRVATEPKEKLAELYARMSAVAENELSDLNTAADYLNQALDLEPGNNQTLTKLLDLFERSERYDEMVELLRERVRLEKDQEKQVALYRRIGSLLADKLEDEEAAAKIYRTIIRIKADIDALRFLRLYALKHDDAKRLVAVLEKLIEVETDPKECRDLLYEYGRILNTRMKRPKEAIAVLQRLLKEFDPRFEPAIDELLVASEKIGNPSLLVEALERQLAIEPDAKAKADLARRIAELYQLEIKQPQGTISALHEWMRLDADNPEPRRRLSELMEKAGSHAELIPVLDELAVLETKEEKRNDAAIKASQLLFEKLHDPEGAWNRLVPLVERGVFKADDAISSLAVKSNRLDALCDLFERTGKYRKLIEILSRQAEVEKDPQKRLAFYRRIARDRFERLQDERGAAQAWQHVLEVGEDVEALEFLRQQAIRNDDVEQLTDILGRLAPLEINAGERRDLMFDRAQLLTTRLGRPQESIAILRDILDTLDPKYQPAIDALISACEAAGDIKGLAAALERQLDMERHSDARAQLARRLSEIYLSDLKDSQAAIRALWLWGQAESINPEPYRRLRALLQQTDRFEELIAVLDELAQLETDETHGIEAALSAADLTYRRLMDTDGAWRRLATLVEKGCEAADQALIRIATETNRLGDLYDVFERAEKYHALVALLHREVSAEKDAEKRVELHRRIARLLTDRLQDSSAATEAWRSLLEIRDDKEALGALRFEVAKSDDAEALADIIKRMAALETDGAERRDLLFEHARLLNERLNRSGEAVEILKQILELDPRFEPAIDQFVAAAEALGDQASIADALERQLAINREAKTRADLARRLAELYLLENNPKRAIAALMVWAQAEPKDPEPRRELRGLLEKARRYRELVAVLDELSEMEPETEAQIETALAAAEFAHKKLRDLEGAWNRYIPLLRHRVSRAEEALRKIARESRREKQLASIYTALAQQSTEAELSAAHWYHAAEIFETDLNQPEQALEAALRRLALDLANTSYLEEVERLAVKVNAWPRLAQVYSRMVAQTEEKRDKVALLVRYADLLDEKAKDAAAAQKTILQASALDPDNEQLLDRAQELSLLANDTHEFYEAFERRYQNASSDSERVRYLLRVAQIVDTRLRDREQTKELIKRAVKLTLNAPELAEQIESAARAMDKERPDSAESNLLRTVVEGYQALLSNRNDKHDTARVLRTARLLSGELKDDSSAFDVLRRGLSRYPADREIYQEAERVAVKIRRLDALDALLARALNQTMDKDTTILILENRARLIKDRLNRYDEAAEVYQIILDLDPEHGEARQSLLSCLEKGGRYLELVRMMEKQCSAISDPHAQLELMKQIAVIWEQQLLNLWEAIEVWKKIQEAAPDDAAAAEALQRLQQVSLPSIRPKK
ncbi:MAG: hypothetical protein JXA30_22360 [Deltaproteobacteria bacterium]|nr:hypothetical protein [Deltaproteobacteria bacterium]